MTVLKSFLVALVILIMNSTTANAHNLELSLDMYANLVDSTTGDFYQVGADKNNGTSVKFKLGLGVNTMQNGDYQEYLNVLNFKSDKITKTINGRTFDFMFYTTVRLVTLIDKDGKIYYGNLILKNKTEVNGKIWNTSTYQSYNNVLETLMQNGGFGVSMVSEIDPSNTVDLGNGIIMQEINVDLN